MKENSYINVHPQCTPLLLWEAALNEGGGRPAAESQVSSAVSTVLNSVPRKHAHRKAEPSGIHTRADVFTAGKHHPKSLRGFPG